MATARIGTTKCGWCLTGHHDQCRPQVTTWHNQTLTCPCPCPKKETPA